MKRKIGILFAAIAAFFIASSGAFAQTPTPTATATATPSTSLSVSPKSKDLNVGPGTFLSSDALPSLRLGLANLVPLTDGATITADTKMGSSFSVTLAGNRTVVLTNHSAGNTMRLVLTQDGVGSRTITWDAAIHWPSGTAPTLSTGAAKTDIFQCFDTGTVWACSTVGLNY